MLIALLVVVVIAAAMLMRRSSETGQAEPSAPPSTVTTDTGTSADTVMPSTTTPDVQAPAATEVRTVKEFTVAGANFSFAPSTITVRKGDRVKITLNNTEGFHDLKIDDLNVATKRIQSGEKDTIEFTADKAGSFEYYCSVGHHRDMGMKGTLVVEE